MFELIAGIWLIVLAAGGLLIWTSRNMSGKE